MLIDGIGLAGYRSFGPDIQYFGPLAKVSFLVGRNNSGKSNVVRYLKQRYQEVLACASSDGTPKFDVLDTHIGQDVSPVCFGLARSREALEKIVLDHVGGDWDRSAPIRKMLGVLLESGVLGADPDVAWFCYEADSLKGPIRRPKKALNRLKKVLNGQQWQSLFRFFNPQTSGGDVALWIQHIFDLLSPASANKAPDIHVVPAIRSVRGGENAAEAYGGAGIIHKLARLQNPGATERPQHRRFQRINKFVQEVMENPTARLEVPYERDTIQVHMDEKCLPLESVGTGIEQLIILAVAGTVLQDCVLCIEEPEIHQHPVLQRKLVQYLSEETSNQYVITTHSAHLLDTPGAAVFHVDHDGRESRITLVSTPSDRSEVCIDLGYRPSDLVQSNSVIWVEGPSDRIYLSHWIAQAAPELAEGLHFSIMFYGGRLLSHLTADDPEVNDFISLRKLNRFMVVVMDSDKRTPHTRLNETKKRVAKELKEGGGIAWVTKGRTIENYVPSGRLQDALKAVHPSASKLLGTDQYDDCTKFRPKKGGRGTKTVDKVKFARAVTGQTPPFGVLDLKKQITRVVAFIREANGMS